MRRALTSLLLVLTLTAPAAAWGQSKEEVLRAQARAEAATAAAGSARARTAGTEARLIEAVRRYEALTAEITATSFELADGVSQTRAREADHRLARDEARQLIVDAYVSGAAARPHLLGAERLPDLALHALFMGRVADLRAGRLRALAASTADLDARHRVLDATRVRLASLREAASAAVPVLAELVLDARVQEAFAMDQERSAIEEYELEAAELEAALALVSARALQWKALIEEHFPDSMTWAALQVLDCESRGDPDAVNEASGSTGLFQFLEGTWVFASAGAGFEGADRRDPEANVAAAAWLVLRSRALAHPRGAWGHWQCQPGVPEPD